jgi:uncharacterized protein
MKTTVTALAAGATFGVGLSVSGMTQPGKVIGFLDLAGEWDPSLALVMAGAIATHALFALRAREPGARPWLASRMDLPANRPVDAALVAGAAVFGVGWGLAGYCPGPAIACLSSTSLRTVAFVAAMAAGVSLARLVQRRFAVPSTLPALRSPS